MIGLSIESKVIDLFENLILGGEVQTLQVDQVEDHSTWHVFQMILAQVQVLETRQLGESVLGDARYLI